MRVAVVVAPPDAPSAKLRALLSGPGAFRVVEVAATPFLEADFAKAAAQVSAGDQLFVYVGARTALLGADAALRIDDAEPASVTLRAMGNAAAAREPGAALFVVEAEHDGEARDAMRAAEHVDGVSRALEARARGFAVLVGARAQALRSEAGEAGEPWPLTRLFVRALEAGASRDDDGAVRVARAYEAMRAAPDLAALVQSYTLVRGRSDFLLAPAPVVVPGAPSSVPASSAPRPHLTPLLLGAEEACEREDWEEALDAFKKALMLVSPDDGASLATIYANIGEVKRAQGKPREAELNFEKALAASPGHRRSVEALIDVATAEGDPRRAVEYRLRLLPALPNDAARVRELLKVAELQRVELKDAKAARATLERAREVAPRDGEVLLSLKSLHEEAHAWKELVEVLDAMAEAATTAEERARHRFAQGDVVMGRLRDEPRGLALFDAALVEDPRHDGALHAIVAVLSSRGDFDRLGELYARLVDLYAKLGDKKRAHDVCQRLGVVRRDKLRDGPGALEAFTGAVQLEPSDVDTRAMLVDLHLARGDEGSAVAELEAIAQLAPTRHSTFVRLHHLHARAGRRDRAWLAASALVELGHATNEQRVLYEEMRPDGTFWPAKALDHEAWDTLLRAPGADPVVTGVLGAIIPAAVKMRVAELVARRQIVTLDPARRQPPGSTASIVRCFVWAAQVLGVTLPELYVLDDVPGGLAAVQAEPPATALGPGVTQGVGASELAFLAGRHLAYYRPEHYALVFFPTVPELSALFLAAVKLALPEVPVPESLHEPVARIRKALGQLSTPEERGWLQMAVKTLEARGGRVDLAAWARGVELTANRAGLLLCGDLGVACRRVRDEGRRVADVSDEERRDDLLAFVASPELGDLRAALAITARPSSVPPPPSSSARPPP
jgi:tetratricopeptide (TPR) repeat protein